ncbi:polyketide synthase [Micromonospora sp. NBC_01699]|uniref:polyketide synthase n=1 Tax=Micromonospora sp. NBC_01699 TaxID=2975984 RepID=UPI002E285E65|nr:polyketide synthase [Micromonospora sp. NBC_01699]
MFQVIRVREVEPGVAELTLDDAEHDNRLSDRLCDELLAALAQLAQDPQLKVLILRGRPEVFCAGATMEALQRVLSGALHVKDLLLSRPMLDFPVPIVGALEGHAVGGGLVLALCCDLVVAARNRRYAMNFARMGFTPAMGTTALLPAAVGAATAAELTLTARYYRGGDLDGRGFFNAVVPADEVFPTALEFAQRIAEKPRHVLELTKETLAQPRRQLLRAAMSREHLMHRVCFGRPEVAEIVAETYLT